MTNQQQEWLDFAKSVALEAGYIMRKYFGKKPDSHLKANNTIVTVADEEINNLVIKRVTERYPATILTAKRRVSAVVQNMFGFAIQLTEQRRLQWNCQYQYFL